MTRVHFETGDRHETVGMTSSSPSLRVLASYGRPRYEDGRRVLFVLRESALNAEHELANLASVVLGQHEYREELAVLAAAGVAPLREPHEWGGKSLPVAEGSMSLVPVGDSWVLYALTSAAKDSAEGDNPFTTQFTRALRELRPEAVVTGSVSRIVRHEHHVSAVSKALRQCRATLDCTERVLDFRRQSAGADFMEIATDAIRERAGIVSRLEGGILTAADRGMYPFPAVTLPIGYRRTEKKKIVLGSAREVEAIQHAFQLLADHTVSVARVADSLVAANVFMTAKSGRNGSGRKALSRDLARHWVRRLLARVEVYQHGVHVMRRRANSVAAGPTDDDGPALPPVAICRFELPRPEGGWASDEVFAAVRERALREGRRNRLASTTTEKHSRQLPLAGYRWRQDDMEYAVLSRRGGSARGARYVLAGRPAADFAVDAQPGGQPWTRSMGRGWGQPSASDSRFQCMVLAQDLHRSIARELGGLNTFEFAESAELLGAMRHATAPTASQEGEVRAIEAQLKHAQLVRSRAHDAFYSAAADDPMADTYKSDYTDAVATTRRLSAYLADLRTRPAQPTAQEPWTCSAGDFLLALARLHETPDTLPRQVVSALHAVFYGFTLSFDPDRGEVTWELALRLLTQKGTGERLTKKISGRVTVAPTRSGPIGAAHREEAAVRRALDHDLRDHHQRQYAIAGLRRYGVTSPGAASSLLDAPLELRRVVIGHLLDMPMDETLDPAYVAAALGAYLGDHPSTQRRWNAGADSRQGILDVLSHRGPMDHTALLRTLGRTDSWELFDGLCRNGDGAWLGVAMTDRYFVGASNDSGQRVRVMCRTCPHCGGSVDVVARVRECAAGLLCSACLRMPVPDSPQFPPFYSAHAARPQARRPVRRRAPKWWSELRRLHAERPDMSITVLASALGKRRFEVREACEMLDLTVRKTSGIPTDWTDTRLRYEYVERDRRLPDLAYEIGVSTGTLSKRLKRAGISKYRPRQAG